jgi:hypothetical protein
MDKLENALRRYEAAISTTVRDGDDSDEAVNELEAARRELLNLLRRAKDQL